MLTLADYRQTIEEIEKGDGPPADLDRDLALRSLVHEICGRPWDTAEEQEKAQCLVIRLERLRHILAEQK